MPIKKSGSIISALLLGAIIILQFGCKKNDDVANTTPTLEPPVNANDAVKVAATISGSVIDETNKPVAGAVVTSDTYSATTDAMGNFVFKNINISAANGYVSINKAGYYKATRSFVTDAGKNNYVKIQLIKKVPMGTITAAGGAVNTLTGASITFPANAFVTANGTAYTGSVIVYATWIDPTAPNLPLVVPGDLRGINSSNGEYLLKSYGMIGAEFEDNSGNALKMAPGKTAAVVFPIPASLQATAPATIPLWHFNDTIARWKEEGTATKNGNTYIAQVNKFSFWNVDVPANFIKLDVTLLNSANNLPLANTLVKITSLATNTSAYDFTNDSGFVSGYVPKNENLKLEVIAGTACANNTVVYTQNIGPYTSNTALGNISVTVPANQVINFTGTVRDCNNQPVTNGYISLSLANGTSTIAYANATGAVSFSVIHCGGTQTYTYNAVNLATGAYSTTATGTATTASVNLGVVSACGNVVNTSGVYIAGVIDNNAVLWKDGVPTFLTNYPSSSTTKYSWAVKTLVYNNNVYVLGNDQDSTINGNVGTIKLWKDGVATNITSGTTYAEAFGFDVYNNDVYICGEESNSTTSASDFKVWKNGVVSILTKDTFSYLEVNAIKVINGDVYVTGFGSKQVAGTNNFLSKAIYWKNGVINVLTGAGNIEGSTNNITAFNGDVYIVGSEGTPNQINQTIYWKNGVKIILPLTGIHTNSEGNAVFVDNNDVYVAGHMGFSNSANFYKNAAFWKNGAANLVTNYTINSNEAYLYDIFVKNNIVYTVGEQHQSNGPSGNLSPLYFQNGIPVPLSGVSSTQRASAYSIFVK